MDVCNVPHHVRPMQEASDSVPHLEHDVGAKTPSWKPRPYFAAVGAT